MGWDALLSLPEAVRNKVLDNLLDVRQGAGLCFNRLPVAASDFSTNVYSYDDTKDDYELKNFSIARDREKLIPCVKAAQSRNHGMKFHASPWSPPAWMKEDGAPGKLKNDERTLIAHANYLVNYLKAYEAEGIISRLFPQNELLNIGGPVGCNLTPEPFFSDLMQRHVIPAVRKSGLKTEI